MCCVLYQMRTTTIPAMTNSRITPSMMPNQIQILKSLSVVFSAVFKVAGITDALLVSAIRVVFIKSMVDAFSCSFVMVTIGIVKKDVPGGTVVLLVPPLDVPFVLVDSAVSSPLLEVSEIDDLAADELVISAVELLLSTRVDSVDASNPAPIEL